MRRILLAAAALGAPLLLSLAFIGCGPPKDNDSGGATDTGSGGGATTPTQVVKLQPLEGKEGAVLKGRVTIKGAKPDVAALTQQFQEAMKGKPDDLKTCFDLAPEDQKTQQKWVLGDNGGVGNVVVWIQPPSGAFFKVDPAQNGKWWPDTVELNQPHCAFVPHVAWVVPGLYNPADPKNPMPSGQKFTVSNTAAISHNTKWSSAGGGSNGGSLSVIPPHAAPKPVELKGNNQLVRFQCDIHAWMDAYVWVFNHPYAAVTKPDGTFEIKNVPAGSKVRITAWHEQGPYQGFLTAAKIKGDEIPLEAESTEHNFELEVK